MIADEARKNELFQRLVRGRASGLPIAVAGASRDPNKYGHIIVRYLAGRGYTVSPIRPSAPAIAGLPAFPSLSALPGPVEIVDVVTPPAVSRKILAQAEALGLPVLWFQDGSWDEQLRPALDASPVLCILGACVMVVAGRELPPGA